VKVLIALTIRLKLNFTQETLHVMEFGTCVVFIFDAYFLVDVNITVFVSDAYMIRNYDLDISDT